MNSIDWQKLQAVYDAARVAGVSFTLVYEESVDQFYCTADSPAPSERWAGKSRGFDVAIASVLEWLGSLKP